MGLGINWKNKYRQKEFMRRFKSTLKGGGVLALYDVFANRTVTGDKFFTKKTLALDGLIILHQFHDLVIPLFNVVYYQSAISHENLEYRSIGAEFLAQQKGGHFGLRVDMVLPDDVAIPMFLIYEMITAYSKPTRDFDQNSVTFTVGKRIEANTQGWGTMFYFGRFVEVVSTPFVAWNIQGLIDELAEIANTYDDILDVTEFDIDSLRTPYRRTCTFMTRETAYYNIYVETIRMGKRDIDGPNNTRITLLFREFRPEDKRVKEMKYFRYYTSRQKGKYVKDAEYSSRPAIAVKYSDDYEMRNAILKRLKEKMKKMMVSAVANMMGIPASAIVLLPRGTVTDIIDVPQFYDFLFNVGISIVGLFSGRDKTVKEFRVGGHVIG